MPRYTKAEREGAALICAVSESNGIWGYEGVIRLLGRPRPSERVIRLALDAWKSARGCGLGIEPHLDAEAEALIRNKEI